MNSPKLKRHIVRVFESCVIFDIEPRVPEI